MSAPRIPPIERAIEVSWKQEAAFRRFTEQFADWWPWRSHSIGGRQVRRVVFETRAGGRIYEEHAGGRRFQWGQVVRWDPPRSVRFTWHPARDPATAQEVEVRFHPQDQGTRVVLTASAWENWGPGGRRASRGYKLGWGYVLNVWAARRTAGMAILDGLGLLVEVVQKLRGGTEAAIARAGGEIRGPD